MKERLTNQSRGNLERVANQVNKIFIFPLKYSEWLERHINRESIN